LVFHDLGFFYGAHVIEKYPLPDPASSQGSVGL